MLRATTTLATFVLAIVIAGRPAAALLRHGTRHHVRVGLVPCTSEADCSSESEQCCTALKQTLSEVQRITLKRFKDYQKYAGKCAPTALVQSACSRESSPQTSSVDYSSIAAAKERSKSKPVEMPEVNNGNNMNVMDAKKELEKIKERCAQKSTDFTATSMCERDRCVVKGVATVLHQRANIMDCAFNNGVKKMCEKASVAPLVKRWAKCPTLWAAYENTNDCADKSLKSEDGKLVVYRGLLGQKMSEVRTKSGVAAVATIQHRNSEYIFNEVISNGYAVCATIAQAALYAHKAAGLVGRLDLVQENYGGGSGHIFLLYSTRQHRPDDPNDACPQGFTNCYTQFIDHWYAGLSQDFGKFATNLVDPYNTDKFMVPYTHRPDNGRPVQPLTWHVQNSWIFGAHRHEKVGWISDDAARELPPDDTYEWDPVEQAWLGNQVTSIDDDDDLESTLI